MPTKTYVATQKDIDSRQWFVVDAEDQILGRMATRIAEVLRGKHKPTYTAHLDVGDFVVVVNAEKIKLSGRKATEKMYQSYSGYPGGHKVFPITTVRAKDPTRIVRLAVQRMMPKNILSREQFGKLHVYVGPDHPHAAQNPKPMKLGRF